MDCFNEKIGIIWQSHALHCISSKSLPEPAPLHIDHDDVLFGQQYANGGATRAVAGLGPKALGTFMIISNRWQRAVRWNRHAHDTLYVSALMNQMSIHFAFIGISESDINTLCRHRL